LQTKIFEEANCSNLVEEEWNDQAQSEKEGPALITQVLLILGVSTMVMVFFLGM